MDRVEIEGLRVECIIGVLERERRVPQPLVADLVVELPWEPAALAGDLARSLDYAALAAEVSFLAREGHWRLLESLAVVLLRSILADPTPGEGRAAVVRATVRLRKPEIRGIAVPGVAATRDTAWCQLETAIRAGIPAEVLLETAEAGAYRIRLESPWDLPESGAVHVLAGAVTAGGRPLVPGGEVVGPARLDGVGSLLVVARPRLA